MSRRNLCRWRRTALARIPRPLQPGEPRAKLQHLFELAASSSADLLPVELALRDWSRRDGDVAAPSTGAGAAPRCCSSRSTGCSPSPGAEVTGRTARRPVLVFDGDCAFCTSCARLLERIRPEADVVALQVADLNELGITAAQAGHEAFAAALGTAAGSVWRIVGRGLLLPGVSPLAAAGYRLVARNRHRLPGGTPACASTQQPRSPST